MQRESFRRLIGLFVRQYRMTFVLLLVFTGIFAGVFILYNVHGEAVLYGSLMCTAILITVFIIEFINFCREHKKRTVLINNISLMTEELPPPQTPAEADYIKMIEILRNENRENFTRFRNERSDCMDYYTTWVHQIKTPISVMQMILQSEDTDEHRELSAELFRIEQYAEMALSYLRLDSSSNDFVIKEYELDGIIRNAVRKYAARFIRKKIQLKYEGTDVKVITDAKWLLFMLEQLLSNAIKYTEKGTVTISVSEDKILSVSDTGIGIAEEDIPRIFEKSYTGYNGRENTKSTGLGLYLCKKTSDKLSHKIYARSDMGEGSTFYIDLRTYESF